MDLPESVLSIASRSRFEHIHVTGSQYRGPYATVYEALAGVGSHQEDIALRILDTPETSPSEFADRITDTVGEFAPVTTHERLVTVLDYGARPRPWLATTTIDERLTDRRPMDFVSPLTTARELVEGVAHLHQQDLIHGGLDPGSIVFVGSGFEDVGQGTPLVDNAGLMHEFRYAFEPANYLEPAYAAPEYYSQQHGVVDHQTDIYQLGATLFYLLTGQPPYRGSFREIRSQVLDDRPPTPSEAGAPAVFDDIIRKAMASEKIKRYETVEYLQNDLEMIVANREYEWVDGE
jgi:serine/threonine protein kinase